jgi:hypothetical protein
MSHYDLLTLLEEGVANGRIAPHLAAYIAAEILGVAADETEYTDRLPLDDAAAQ